MGLLGYWVGVLIGLLSCFAGLGFHLGYEIWQLRAAVLLLFRPDSNALLSVVLGGLCWVLVSDTVLICVACWYLRCLLIVLLCDVVDSVNLLL